MPQAIVTPEQISATVSISTAPWSDAIEDMIASATTAIESFTGREFIEGEQGELRRFAAPWPGAREIPVGDLMDLPTSVSVLAEGASVPTALALADIVALPLVRRPGWPITRLRLPWGLADGAQLEVTGQWGWPEIPADVRQAAAAAVREALGEAQRAMRAETADEGGPSAGLDLPAPARRLLGPYRRRSIR